MKMYMPLTASEDGVVQFVKQPGVGLGPGDILGILTLDDPARVKHAKPFEGLLPSGSTPSVIGNKPHQRFRYLAGVLDDILDGYDNQAIMHSTLKDLIDTLHNPELPYSEMNVVMSSLSGRIPAKLEESIRSAVDAAKAKGDNTEFPAVRLKKILDNFIQDNIRPTEEAMFRGQISSISEIAERYYQGLKEHETNVLGGLLKKYGDTEALFTGSIEARVLALREQNKDDLDKVVSLVLSHSRAQSKSKLIMTLLDHVKASGLTVSNPDSFMYQVLQSLAALENRSSSAVALKAREVLISCQMPSYEERRAQMEAILKSSVTSSFYGEGSGARFAALQACYHTGLTSKLGHRRLRRSRNSSIRGILSTTCYLRSSTTTIAGSHLVCLTAVDVRTQCLKQILAAFDVYVRRSYRAYSLLSVDYEEGDGLDDGEEPNAVVWRFNLGQTREPPATPQISLDG
jgi:acetyl-CoA carboxylase/biotin carboxylase 1